MLDFIQKIKRFPLFLNLFKIFSLNRHINTAPSSLAYYLLISLIPSSTSIYSLLKLLNLTESEELFIIEEIRFLNSLRIEKSFSSTFAFIFSLIITLYLSSRGIENFFYYCNKVYGLNSYELPFIKRKIRSILFSLLLILGVSGLLFLAQLIFYIFSFSVLVKSILAIIFLLISLFLLLSFTYKIIPLKKLSFKEVYFGALIATLGIVFGIVIYRIYLSLFSNYENYYGLLSSLIVLLISLFIISYCILLGVQINNFKKDSTLKQFIFEDLTQKNPEA